jgi:hypothetical protein
MQPGKSLYTTIRELVENSLDAAESVGVLPEIKVTIEEMTEAELDELRGLETRERVDHGLFKKKAGKVGVCASSCNIQLRGQQLMCCPCHLSCQRVRGRSRRLPQRPTVQLGRAEPRQMHSSSHSRSSSRGVRRSGSGPSTA